MIRNYGEDYFQLFDDLRNSQQIVEVSRKKFQELINIIYELKYYEEALRLKIGLPCLEDKEERDYLLWRTDDVIKVLQRDRNSRQAVFSVLYNNNLGKCISLVHFFIRDEKVYLNTYFRSQEGFKNFDYDFQTHCLLANKVAKFLNIDVGKITVFVANFHRTIE